MKHVPPKIKTSEILMRQILVKIIVNQLGKKEKIICILFYKLNEDFIQFRK